jgi:hypothetical protein
MIEAFLAGVPWVPLTTLRAPVAAGSTAFNRQSRIYQSSINHQWSDQQIVNTMH